MLTRALIVLLLVLNLGVAAWWLTRARPAPPTPFQRAPGVARLQLSGETGASTAPAPQRRPQALAVSQCVSLGPFADQPAAERARVQLQPYALSIDMRREYAGTADSWRVFMPPLASLEQAEAAAQRVAAAGFSDYYVVRKGDDAGSVALGLYSDEATARERVATLVAAGFAAQTAPVGAGPAVIWLDVAGGDDFDPGRVQALTGAPQRQELDCAAKATADERTGTS